MSLETYKANRDFRETPEPTPRAGEGHRRPIFVVQEHHASHLHYDFRLEADGVLKSWAVPKEPSPDPAVKRLAVQVEDHPLDYASFEGAIPEHQYGAGTVRIWDRGTYDNLLAEKAVPQTVTEGIEAGRLEFALHGTKLQGRFALIRMQGLGRGKVNWLLIKMKDEFAQPGADGAPKTRKTAARGSPNKKSGASGRANGSPVPEDPPPSAVRPARPAEGPSSFQEFTHTDKVFYPDDVITKGDVLAYYERIADRLLPYLRDRPATLERLPDGLGGPRAPHFWQKDTPAYYPDWIPRVELPTDQGKMVHYALVNDKPTLLYLVNQGTLTFHVWSSRVADLDRPDYVLFDLDPGLASFADAVAVARQLRATLAAEGNDAFVKTSGKAGVHVLVPWAQGGEFDDARAWALGIAGQVEEALPDRATSQIRKAKRGGRVYLDVMQNAKGHHAVPPYVLRAVPGAPVSTPLSWRELSPDLDSARFNLKTIFRRLSHQKSDPMAEAILGGPPAGRR